MKRATGDSSRRTVPAPNRRRLLPEARRLLWPLLRARARGPRRALRQRLHTFLRAASGGTLLRLVRQAAVAGAVALALATSASAADAIELADATEGRGGFIVEGHGTRTAAGIGEKVANAGDVNGDGIPDVIVGGRDCRPEASGYSYGYCSTVPSYVVFGKETTEPVDLAEIAAGRGGFVIRAESEDARSGWSVSGAGDVDGDGLADLVIGAPGWPRYAPPACYGCYDYSSWPGSSYVVFGKEATEPVELTDVAAGEGGFTVRGFALGFHVSGAGDVDGDGLSDVVVRRRGHWGRGGYGYPQDPGTPGATHVIFGGGGGFVISDGYVFDGDYYWSAAGAGDVNGDGHADIIIGAPTIDARGASYVVFGKATPENITLADVAAGNGGFVIRGESEGDNSGYSVAAAGDVDGDGLADLLIGAPDADPGDRVGAGATYVVLGKASREAVELSDVAAGEGGFVIRGENTGDQSGASVSAAGDVDGDGLADVLTGVPGADPGGRESGGASYVVFGKDTTEAIELADVAGSVSGFEIRGELAGDWSGTRVSGGGDINGDGVPDVVMGNARKGVNGRVHVVFGPLREGVPRFRRGEVNGDLQVDLSDAIATVGYLFLGDEAPACFDAADVNDDGQVDISDVIVTVGYLYRGDERPPVPGPTHCGIDPTDDALACESPSDDCL